MKRTTGKPQSGSIFIDRAKKMIAAPEERNILSPINGLEEQNRAGGYKHLVPKAL
jgi:hypothetical protein